MEIFALAGFYIIALALWHEGHTWWQRRQARQRQPG
jgi:hypothetical protein